MASDVLTNESTMMILVKHVIKIRMLGARERTVSKSSSLTDVLTFAASLELNISINSFILCCPFSLCLPVQIAGLFSVEEADL